MKTTDIFKHKLGFSFEVFPPKRTSSIDTIYKTLDGLKNLQPDFISVTYGAGGSSNCKATVDIASAIKHKYNIESVAHLPCIGLSKDDILAQLDEFKRADIENILALRGDIPEDITYRGDFAHASDLITFIKEHGDFNILAACYPEGHRESKDILDDIQKLKIKVEAGTNQLVTQLFFDNDYFYKFRERCAIAGINVPIEAGIMPVVNKKQIERMVSLCHVKLPEKFKAIMNKYEHNPEALRDAGIAYAISQIVDLIAHDVDGIHLYTMNNPYIATKIYEAIHTLLDEK